MALQELSVGVTLGGSVLDEVLLEMLDHQGIIYEQVSDGNATNYPAVLLSKFSDEAYSKAASVCSNKDNIVIASEVADLNSVLASLSGLQNKPADNLDLKVNREESKLVKVLQNKFSSLTLPLIRKSYWPNNAKACCILTHDIDWFHYSPFHKTVVYGRPRKRILATLIRGLLRRANYGWNIPDIVSLHNKYNVKSTFFLQTDYGKDDHFFKSSVGILTEGKFEIALHASHLSHRNEDRLRAELATFSGKVGFSPHGIRYHTLKFKVPDTWQMESDFGVDYDATFSHNDYFGFRSDICYPYHPLGARRYGVLELPTSFMDWTALNRKVRGKALIDTLKTLKQQVENYNGVLVVNFHNTYLNRNTFPDVIEAYEFLIEDVLASGFWIATARQCTEWWKLRCAALPRPVLDNHKIKLLGSPISMFVDGKDTLVSSFSDKGTADSHVSTE